MNKIDDLKWIRIFTPSHIPKYLIEQVRDRDFTVEDFYKYHEINCTIPSKDGSLKLNPFSHLYVLGNEENEVKGVLWFCIDPLTKDIVVQTFSMDKDYWMKGIAVKKLANHIKDIRKKGNLKKIYWITNYPKHSERNGFKRAKAVLMEYNEEREVKIGKDTNGRHREEREHRSADASTEQLPERSIGSSATAAC
jgi:N-acetylglutamate synthase-like GNAT family acetyltransferase